MSSRSDQDTGNPSTGEGNPKATVKRTITIIGDHIDSHDLFVGTREIIIGHGEDRYKLKLTPKQKLIMTK